MIETADFDGSVCTSAEKFVNDQDLDKAVRKFSERSTMLKT